VKKLIIYGKNAQRNILPQKYYFDPDYNAQFTEYDVYRYGAVTLSSNNTIEAIIDNYFARIEMMLSTNSLDAQSNIFVYIRSLAYAKEQSFRINGPWVIGPALNKTYGYSELWYNQKIS
jgi:hypothetical protein